MLGGDISDYLKTYAERSADARRNFACREDLRYGPPEAEVLDFFPAASPDAPLFVFIHGGYWHELSHKESAPMAARLLEAGFAFATLNYTLAPRATVAVMIEEVARALRFLQESASDLGFDPRRITLSGHSAGAHLAAMQIMRRAPPFASDGLEHLLLLSGIYDLEPIALTSINGPLGLSTAQARSLSPMSLTPVIHPRVTVAVAERDTREFRRQSKDFALHLGRHGLDARHLLVPGRNHFDISSISASRSAHSERGSLTGGRSANGLLGGMRLQSPHLGIIIPIMGMNAVVPSGLAEALFSSVQQRVLALFFGRPDRELSTSDVIRLAKSGTGAVHRELRRLANSGLLKVTVVGNQRRYRANRESPIFEELHKLILKTAGLVEPLKKALSNYQDRIRTAFVYGSVARGEDTSRSDIDLLIIGDDLTYADNLRGASGDRKSPWTYHQSDSDGARRLGPEDQEQEQLCAPSSCSTQALRNRSGG